MQVGTGTHNTRTPWVGAGWGARRGPHLRFTHSHTHPGLKRAHVGRQHPWPALAPPSALHAAQDRTPHTAYRTQHTAHWDNTVTHQTKNAHTNDPPHQTLHAAHYCALITKQCTSLTTHHTPKLARRTPPHTTSRATRHVPQAPPPSTAHRTSHTYRTSHIARKTLHTHTIRRTPTHTIPHTNAHCILHAEQ